MFSFLASAAEVKVTLSGAQEVPPVSTKATGSGTISIADTGAVSGSIKTSGIDATAAHIHQGAPNQNGGVIVPLSKAGSDQWNVAPNAKLTEAQMQAFKEGNLYVNVHSAEHKGGEIRGQLKP
jgi:hypothetical protein